MPILSLLDFFTQSQCFVCSQDAAAGMHAVLNCVFVGIAYVAPFYFKASHARNHPSTIKFRMASTAATCLVAWTPLYWQLQKVMFITDKGKSAMHSTVMSMNASVQGSCKCHSTSRTAAAMSQLPHRTLHTYQHCCNCVNSFTVLQNGSAPQLLLSLLGLRRKGLLQAVIQPALLTASLFAGPLLQLLLSATSDAGSIVSLQIVRNLAMAPVTEEFCFRACMAPLFLLQVGKPDQIILLIAIDLSGSSDAGLLLVIKHWQLSRRTHVDVHCAGLQHEADSLLDTHHVWSCTRPSLA